MSVVPVIVLVVMVPTRFLKTSATPPPEEPSCAAAEPPSARTSIVFVPKVRTSFTEPNTIVGKSPFVIWLASRNCEPYEAITTGVSLGGVVESVIYGNMEGSLLSVADFVIARKAKSYSPVPLGVVFVKTVGFALSHAGEMYASAAL